MLFSCTNLLRTMNFLVSALMKLVERTIRSEHHRSPNRPIYLVGQSFGGCLALAVAAFNPDIDLVLILANPGKKFLFYIYCKGEKILFNSRSITNFVITPLNFKK